MSKPLPKLQKVYDFLKSQGKIKSSSPEEFAKVMQKPGKLEKVFSYLKEQNVLRAESADQFKTTLGLTDPKVDPPAATGKRVKIIANSQYPEFKTEFERTKAQYEKHYPGGVEFVEAYGFNELNKHFNTVAPDQDVIMMAHHNKDAMYGVPVADKEMRTFDAEKGQTLASLFSGLEKKGYKGNCYLGICKGEGVARDMQKAGVNIPMFATTAKNKWVGGNPANNKSFEDFFFGVGGAENTPTFGKPIQPAIGKHYNMFVSDQQQELMRRRASGTPMRTVTPLK